MRRWTRPGATLAELVTTVAALGMLAAVVVPGLQAIDGPNDRLECLANLRAIGVAMHQYAAEDEFEQAIPIQQMMRADGLNGRPQRNGLGGNNPSLYMNYWSYRTADWFAWGGRSAPELFLISSTVGMDLGEAGPYAAEFRPLNDYTPSSDVYQCPADRGYPDHQMIDDSPRANAERRCYDTLGNSYRANLFGFHGRTNAFAIGPWGHRLSTIGAAQYVPLLGDPLFFSMIGLDGYPTEDLLTVGWHGRSFADNVLFVDGSARTTSTLGHESGPPPPGWFDFEFDPPPFNAQLLSHSSVSGWSPSTYPTPGAYIRGDPSLGWLSGYNMNEWPFLDFQNNMR